MSTDLLPLSRRAMSIWAAYRDAPPDRRAHLCFTADLAPAESAALARLGENLTASGQPETWLKLEATASPIAKAEAVAQLLSGLALDVRAINDLVRGLRFGTLGGPSFLADALKKHAEGTPLPVPRRFAPVEAAPPPPEAPLLQWARPLPQPEQQTEPEPELKEHPMEMNPTESAAPPAKSKAANLRELITADLEKRGLTLDNIPLSVRQAWPAQFDRAAKSIATTLGELRSAQAKERRRAATQTAQAAQAQAAAAAPPTEAAEFDVPPVADVPHPKSPPLTLETVAAMYAPNEASPDTTPEPIADASDRLLELERQLTAAVEARDATAAERDKALSTVERLEAEAADARAYRAEVEQAARLASAAIDSFNAEAESQTARRVTAEQTLAEVGQQAQQAAVELRMQIARLEAEWRQAGEAIADRDRQLDMIAVDLQDARYQRDQALEARDRAIQEALGFRELNAALAEAAGLASEERKAALEEIERLQRLPALPEVPDVPRIKPDELGFVAGGVHLTTLNFGMMAMARRVVVLRAIAYLSEVALSLVEVPDAVAD